MDNMLTVIYQHNELKISIFKELLILKLFFFFNQMHQQSVKHVYLFIRIEMHLSD